MADSIYDQIRNMWSGGQTEAGTSATAVPQPSPNMSGFGPLANGTLYGTLLNQSGSTAAYGLSPTGTVLGSQAPQAPATNAPTGPNVTTTDQQNNQALASGTPAKNIPGTAEYNAEMQRNASGQGSTAPSGSEFDAIYAPVLQALSEQSALLPGQYATSTTGAEQSAGQTTATINQQQTENAQSATRQRGEAQGVAGNAIAEARRQAAEVQQGLQSRFGGTTGTGMFAGEIAGRQFAQNVKSFQEGLQSTLGKIQEAEGNVAKTLSNKLIEVQQNLSTVKQQLQDQLKSALNEINIRKGELEVTKGNARVQALQNYQAAMADQTKQFNDYQYNLALQAQKTKDDLATYKEKAQYNFQLALQKSQIKSPVQDIFQVGGNQQYIARGSAIPAGAYRVNPVNLDPFALPEGSGVVSNPPVTATDNSGVTPEDEQAMLDSLGP